MLDLAEGWRVQVTRLHRRRKGVMHGICWTLNWKWTKNEVETKCVFEENNKENLTLCLGIYNMISFISQWNMKETETKNKEWKSWNWDSSCVLHLPWFLTCLFLAVSAEEEHLESWSEGVRPGEEILGVPLTPMEPVRALRKRSPHTWKDSDGHGRAHTDRSHPHAPQHTLARVTRTHTHEHTLSTFEVFPACSQAQSGGGGLSFSFLFCFLILFIYCLFLVKPRDIGENGWVNMGVIPALPRQGAPAHHCISYCRCWRWRSARMSWVSPEKAKQLSVHRQNDIWSPQPRGKLLLIR